MAFGPEPIDSIYNRLVERITDEDKFPETAVKRITNFLNGSFNQVWVEAFSEGLRENQIKATATQLSGWINYSGGPVTNDDLRELGIENVVSADEINEFMDESDLDELVEIVGVQRDEGSRATVELRILTNEDREVEIPAETPFGTQPDSRGNFLRYRTVDDATIPENPPEEQIDEQGRHFVEVDARAEEVGERFNVPTGTITYLVNPPTGVDAVINLDPATGGVDRESNEELRSRAKESVARSVGGGTIDGITGRIIDDTDASDVLIEEFFDGNNPNRPLTTWPHVEVIVDGGIEDDVDDVLQDTRPTGVEHFLNRPDTFTIRTETDINITDEINEDIIIEDIELFYATLGIGEDLFRDKVIQTILNADANIQTITGLSLFVADENMDFTFESEEFTFTDGQLEYDTELRAGRLAAVVAEDGSFFEFETDWEARRNEGITWIDDAESTIPEDGDLFEVFFNEHPPRENIFRFEDGVDEYFLSNPVCSGDVIQIEDELGTVYEEGVDFEVGDNSIVWLEAGDSPTSGRLFTVEYFALLSNHQLRKAEVRQINDDEDVIAVIDGQDVHLEDAVHYIDEGDSIQLPDGSGTPFNFEELEDVSIINADDFRISYEIEEDLPVDRREKVQSGPVIIDATEL